MNGCWCLSVVFLAVLCGCGNPARHYTFISEVTTASVSTYAGVANNVGLPEGYATGTQALFNGPEGLAVDSSGTMYVADACNATIRKITPAGDVTTIAGVAGVQGTNDGKGTQATFRFPKNVALDGKGHLLVADANSGNSLIRQISLTDGYYTVSTLDCDFSASQFPGFNDTHGIAVDSSGNIYVGDYAQGVFKLTEVGSRWIVTDCVSFTGARSVAIGKDGIVYVANDLSGRVSIATGVNAGDFIKDSHGSALSFENPVGLTFDTAGNLYVTSGSSTSNNSVIIKVTTAGDTATLAGSSSGWLDGMGTEAQIQFPTGLAFDGSGNLYAADFGNSLVRKLSSSVGFANAAADSTNTLVTTYAGGTSHSTTASATTAEGKRQIAQFHFPTGVTADSLGNLYLTTNGYGSQNCAVAKVSASGYVTTLAVYPTVKSPHGVAIGIDGNLYIANASGGNVLKLTSTDGFSSVFGTTCTTFSPWTASNGTPRGIVSDGSGGFFVSTESNAAGIYKITATSVTTVAASGLHYPTGMAFDAASQTLYVADQTDSCAYVIRSSNGFSDSVGTSIDALTDAATGNPATFNTATGIAVDASHNVYVASYGDNRVHKISAAGVVGNIAGSGVGAVVDGVGTVAQLNGPWGIAWVSGRLYVTDNNGHTLRRIAITTKPAFN